MKTRVYWYIILFFCLVVTSAETVEDAMVATPPTKISQKDLLSVVSNKKYGIDCFFYGDYAFQLITDILIYERKSSNHRWYEPYEGGSLDPFSLYENVWSPNEEYLVLPLGRLEGFHILQALHALDYLNHKEKGFIRIFMSSDRANALDLHFEHTFWKWVGDDAFLFTATHAYDHNPFIYEIETKKMFALTEEASVFTTIAEFGEVIIEEKKDFTMLEDRDLAEIEVGMTRGIVLLRCGEPISPHHLPVWVYPSKEGYYHYIFYFWPTNDVELPVDSHDSDLRLVAITKVTLEDRGYTSEEPSIEKETYIFPKQVKGKKFTGLKGFQITRY